MYAPGCGINVRWPFQFFYNCAAFVKRSPTYCTPHPQTIPLNHPNFYRELCSFKKKKHEKHWSWNHDFLFVLVLGQISIKCQNCFCRDLYFSSSGLSIYTLSINMFTLSTWQLESGSCVIILVFFDLAHSKYPICSCSVYRDLSI